MPLNEAFVFTERVHVFIMKTPAERFKFNINELRGAVSIKKTRRLFIRLFNNNGLLPIPIVLCSHPVYICHLNKTRNPISNTQIYRISRSFFASFIVPEPSSLFSSLLLLYYIADHKLSVRMDTSCMCGRFMKCDIIFIRWYGKKVDRSIVRKREHE